jgi:hypothetical protein
MLGAEMIRQLLVFVSGLTLAIVFAMCVLAAIVGTFALGKDVVEARGDSAALEARIRHYTDSLALTPDGSIVLRQSEHPIVRFVGSLAVAWVLAFLSGFALERISRLIKERPQSSRT